MGAQKQKLAFWLMPAADAKTFFTSMIDELARRLEAPAFEPHVTLQGAGVEQKRAIELLQNVATSSAAVQLQIAGIEFSDKYTKTLYVQFRPSAEASAISGQIADGVGSRGGYEFDPHLSLLYKTLAQTEKEELAREIKIPFEQVIFDTVKLVSVPTSIKGPADVHAWRTLAEYPLSGSRK